MESVPRRYTDDQLRRILNRLDSIHYVTEHRTEFTNYLLACAGIKSPNVARDVQKTDTCADEAERGITIKSTGNSLSE